MLLIKYNLYYMEICNYKKIKKFKDQNSNSNETCSICLNELDINVLKTSCNHLFHYNCLKKYKKYIFKNNKKELVVNSFSCPNCRYDLNPTIYKIAIKIKINKLLKTELIIVWLQNKMNLYNVLYMLNILDKKLNIVSDDINISNNINFLLKINSLISELQKKIYLKYIYECYTTIKYKTKQNKQIHIDNENNIYVEFNNTYTTLYNKYVFQQ